VVRIFKNKNPGNALLLLLYALVLKFPLFLNPVKPVPQPGTNYLYHLILKFLEPVSKGFPLIFSVMAFLLVFTQATLLNRIGNSLKLFPKPNYLVGMSFLLITSFLKEWTIFSAPLLVNSLMVWLWYRMIELYNNPNPKTSIYNVAVLVGILPLIFSPALAFILLLFIAMIITRPLLIREWMVALLGILTPWYFLLGILFLSDQLQVDKVLPMVSVHLPQRPGSVWITAGFGLLVIPFITGAYYVQANQSKMVIHTRKTWGLLIWFFLVSLVIVFLNQAGYVHLLLLLIPVACFHAAAYYYIKTWWLAASFHWISFGLALAVGYGYV
jgi:hypothetical protein